MCVKLITENGPIDTLYDLQQLWPELTYNYWANATTEDDEGCLCPVNIPESAKLNGATVKRTDSGDFEIVARF